MPGPLSSPTASFWLNSRVPSTVSLTTVRTLCAVPAFLAVLVMTSTLVPAAAGTPTAKDPFVPAVVVAVVVALLLSVATSAMSILASGAAVPATVTLWPAAVRSVGDVTVRAVVFWVWVTYLLVVWVGFSRSRPADRSAVSRTCDADPQVSGEAEPSAFPLVKPIDAVAGSEPKGDGGAFG